MGNQGSKYLQKPFFQFVFTNVCHSLIFGRIWVHMCVFVTTPDQTKNYRDPKFGTHSPRRYLKTIFFRKTTVSHRFSVIFRLPCYFSLFLLFFSPKIVAFLFFSSQAPSSNFPWFGNPSSRSGSQIRALFATLFASKITSKL